MSLCLVCSASLHHFLFFNYTSKYVHVTFYLKKNYLTQNLHLGLHFLFAQHFLFYLALILVPVLGATVIVVKLHFFPITKLQLNAARSIYAKYIYIYIIRFLFVSVFLIFLVIFFRSVIIKNVFEAPTFLPL